MSDFQENSDQKRPRLLQQQQQQEEQDIPQPLVDALDGIINAACMAEFDAAQAGALAELHSQLGGTPAATPTAVLRSSTDKRYVMSLLCINMGRLQELRTEGVADAVRLYSEALGWHPASLEAGLCLGGLLRHEVASQGQLDRVESIWRTSFDATRAYSFLGKRGRPSASASLAHPTVPFSSYNRMIQSREKKMMKELADKLILHFCQEDKLELACPIMNTFRYRYKLSQSVLCYPLNTPSPAAGQPGSEPPSGGGAGTGVSCSYAGGIDTAVPPSLLEKLQYVFRPDAPFWREHNYDFYNNASRSVGYFSYLFPHRELRPANVVEQAISIIFGIVSAKFPDIAKKSTIGE
jgi:hypothetical protein